jgi:iron complex outermembrane receptor protein
MKITTLLPLSALLLVGAVSIHAQTAADTQPKTPPVLLPHPAETMVVLGVATPTPLAESAVAVVSLPVEAQALALESEQDLLRQDASVFLKERGAGGGQADIVLRGASFEQALVLVNGFRVDDGQTSHHNLDLPISLDAMDSIQVLHGAGSTLHGADALSGVVDFLTAAPKREELRLKAGAGSFGENEQSLLASMVRKQKSLRLTASRNFSTGFIADRDYRNQDAALESWTASKLGVTDLLGAVSDRSFGANQFYGAYDSWERTKGWFASARQELGQRTVAAFGYRRHTDEFVLLHDDPSVYENNHTDGSWQTSIRHTVPIAGSSLLLFGIEADGDSIRSYNLYEGTFSYALGIHARNRAAGYVDLDLSPSKSRWNLSAGLREEGFSGGLQMVTSPHLAGSLRLNHGLKLRASGGYGYRLPTYTDLYYSDPATIGNANLKPESAWSGDGGVDWVASPRLMVSATGFYSRQHDSIDYLRSTSASALPNPILPAACPINTWCAANLSGLHFAGVESSATWIPAHNQKLQLAWTQLLGAQPSLHGLQSEYALSFPVENIHATWTMMLRHELNLTNSVAIAKPYQQADITPWNANPYPVWNAALTHDAGRIRPYLRLTNLSNTGYQEISGVAMEGRGICGGLVVQLGR